MTTDHHRAADGSPVPLKRLLIGTAALPAAAFGLMLFFSPDADAVPIPFVIPTASVSFTTGAMGVGSLSGSFTFDPSDGTYSNVEIHLSDTKAATNGPFTVPVALDSANNLLFASNGTSPTGNVQIKFSNSLSNAVDPIIGVFFDTNATFAGQFVRVNASADPQVPEPTSVAILSAALGLLALGRWRVRQR